MAEVADASVFFGHPSPHGHRAGVTDPNKALRNAVRAGDEEALAEALDAGADPNGTGTWEGVPMTVAAFQGDYEVCMMLLEAGAVMLPEHEVVQAAQAGGHVELAESLLPHVRPVKRRQSTKRASFAEQEATVMEEPSSRPVLPYRSTFNAGPSYSYPAFAPAEEPPYPSRYVAVGPPSAEPPYYAEPTLAGPPVAELDVYREAEESPMRMDLMNQLEHMMPYHPSSFEADSERSPMMEQLEQMMPTMPYSYGEPEDDYYEDDAEYSEQLRLPLVPYSGGSSSSHRRTDSATRRQTNAMDYGGNSYLSVQPLISFLEAKESPLARIDRMETPAEWKLEMGRIKREARDPRGQAALAGQRVRVHAITEKRTRTRPILEEPEDDGRRRRTDMEKPQAERQQQHAKVVEPTQAERGWQKLRQQKRDKFVGLTKKPSDSKLTPAQATEQLRAAAKKKIAAKIEHMQAAAMKRFRAGDYADAERIFREALNFPRPHDPQVAALCNNLAAVLEKSGKPQEAEEFYRRGLTVWEANMPADHPRIKHGHAKLAALRKSMSTSNVSPPPSTRADSVRRRKDAGPSGASGADAGASGKEAGPSEPQAEVTTVSPASAKLEQMQAAAMKRYRAGDYVAAERIFREALDFCGEKRDPRVGVVCNNLAATLEKRGMAQEAEALYLRGLTICEDCLPPDHPRIKHIDAKLAHLHKMLTNPGSPPPTGMSNLSQPPAIRRANSLLARMEAEKKSRARDAQKYREPEPTDPVQNALRRSMRRVQSESSMPDRLVALQAPAKERAEGLLVRLGAESPRRLTDEPPALPKKLAPAPKAASPNISPDWRRARGTRLHGMAFGCTGPAWNEMV